MSFALRLKELRTARDMTQGELSKAVKVSQSAIAMYESGKREPKLEAMEIFADFFNVDMNYITGKSDLTTKVTESPAVPHPLPPMTKEDNDLLQAYHNADDDARQAARFVLRDSWPKEEAPPLPPSEAELPPLSLHCKQIYKHLEQIAKKNIRIELKLDEYRAMLCQKKVATFIKETINCMEEDYHGWADDFDFPAIYQGIAKEIIRTDFEKLYVDGADAGKSDLINTIRENSHA